MKGYLWHFIIGPLFYFHFYIVNIFIQTSFNLEELRAIVSHQDVAASGSVMTSLFLTLLFSGDGGRGSFGTDQSHYNSVVGVGGMSPSNRSNLSASSSSVLHHKDGGANNLLAIAAPTAARTVVAASWKENFCHWVNPWDPFRVSPSMK
ncbi:Uncharacterized protein Fot_35461 [Forsythia ovata]|uniref:Uncharacterized protein n=1 Tax=Forsythia ovata TaxID=205694 RepID=A0ABD1SMN8_9LAMI